MLGCLGMLGCGPVGDDISASWECMNGGGSEYCDPTEDSVDSEGEQGPQGIPGRDGAAGTDGRDGVDGVDGAEGDQGIPGTDGVDGADGTSCSVIQLSDRVRIECEDGTVAEVLNGTDGEDGLDGESCTVTESRNGNNKFITISCPDGTNVTYKVK